MTKQNNEIVANNTANNTALVWEFQNLSEGAAKVMHDMAYSEVMRPSTQYMVDSAWQSIRYFGDYLRALEVARGKEVVEARIDVNRSAATLDKGMALLLRGRWPRFHAVSQTDYNGKTPPNVEEIRRRISEGITVYLEEVLPARIAQDALG